MCFYFVYQLCNFPSNQKTAKEIPLPKAKDLTDINNNISFIMPFKAPDDACT